ncbi:MAG: glycosyltransferase family 4 protein, partial [Candidatus Thermoplasmatota archaeon]|nr:glycosyltransferase family 4 protein [Candidatus Thermoplasmatota archaeon]
TEVTPSRELDGIPVERLPVIKQLLPGVTMPILPGLTERLVKWSPDVIHAHSHRYGHLLQSSLAAGVSGTPLVVSTHYHPAVGTEPSWKKALLRGQDRLFGMTVYSRADRVIVETRHEETEVSDFVDPSKIRVVPPGLSWDLWRDIPPPEAVRSRLSLPKEYILFAGRLAPNKGLMPLVEAWSGLAPARRLPLIFVGQEWGMRSLIEKRVAELGVKEEIRFLGNLKSLTDYISVFSGATLFVLPSEYEAFGLVLLEAMAASLPIVATRVGGIPEAVKEGETALLVPYGNIWALRNALDQVISDPPFARRLGKAGRQRVEECFSWEKTAAAFVSVYGEVT